jgi:hypothetical protein
MTDKEARQILNRPKWIEPWMVEAGIVPADTPINKEAEA